MAQRAETNMAECSLASCVWLGFRIGSHTMPGHSEHAFCSFLLHVHTFLEAHRVAQRSAEGSTNEVCVVTRSVHSHEARFARQQIKEISTKV